jgi:hypothetical protein
MKLPDFPLLNTTPVIAESERMRPINSDNSLSVSRDSALTGRSFQLISTHSTPSWGSPACHIRAILAQILFLEFANSTIFGERRMSARRFCRAGLGGERTTRTGR